MGIFASAAEKYADGIYVLGHERADFDSLASSYLISRWLCRMGVKAQSVLPDTAGEPDEISLEVMRLHGIDPCLWLRAGELNAAGGAGKAGIFLADCHDSCLLGTVAAIIDHHPTSKPLGVAEELCFNRTASSCALAAARLAAADGVRLTDDEEILTVRSVYMDTQSLLSAKFEASDRVWLEGMIKKHSLDEADLRRRGLCLADLSRPVSELALGGLKYYELAGRRCASSHIQAENIPEELLREAAEYLEARRRAEGVCVWILFAAEPLAGRSRVIELRDGGREERTYPRFLSRSKDIIPELERRLSQGVDFPGTKGYNIR